MDEKRQYIRISSSLIVSYRILKEFLLSASRTKNICEGGISIPILERLEPGSTLELKIELADFTPAIEAIGEVIWLNKRDDANFPFIAGIKFIKIETKDRDKIRDHIIEESKEDKSENVRWLG